MDQNRYEEVPQKQGKFKRAFKGFGRWFKFVFVDFFNSFKYNNMKLAGLLILIPGAIFGFFLNFHALSIRDINLTSTKGNGDLYNGLFDYSGLVLFGLMLVCILNIFAGFSLMNKKNKGSVIVCLITTVLIIGLGVLYIYLLMTYYNGGNKFYDAVEGLLKNHPELFTEYADDPDKAANAARKLVSTEGGEYYVYAIQASKRPVMDGNWFLSVGSIVFCMISSVAGVVLGFIKYDRTYEKVRDR